MKTHTIVGFITDLMFISRVQCTVEQMGYDFHTIEHIGQVVEPDRESPDRQNPAGMTGSNARLLELLSEIHPILIIFDIANETIPWRAWIALIKSAPETRRIPVVCFGSHIDKIAIMAARNAGAEKVVARSRFTMDLPGIIEKNSRIPDYDAIKGACSRDLPELARQGIELFNQGAFFEAHELLEDAWNEEEPPGRELYRALLQTAVAYLQIERRNFNGARKMFLRLRQWIKPLPDVCRGVNIRKLRVDIVLVYETLITLGKERIDEFDPALFKQIEYRRIL